MASKSKGKSKSKSDKTSDPVHLEKTLEKKLHVLNSTQDSIQGLSLWIIHHKTDAEKILKTWLKCLKKSKTNHRLTLFYLCNDVVQNCKRKNAKVYRDLFKEVLKDVVPLVRHESIRSSVTRIFKIWDERAIYDEEFIMQLRELLVTEDERRLQQQHEVDAKLLAEFKPQIVVETLRGFRRFETELEMKQRQISAYRLDVMTPEAIKKFKDRNQVSEFLRQFEDAHNKLDDYIQGVEREIKERGALIDLLAMTEHFFELQYGEAKVVANAYKNFGTRVNKQRKHLEEVARTLPDAMSPLPSPSMDAPSPTGSATPPDLAGPSSGNVQVIDMELDEDATAEPILRKKKKDEEAYSPRSEDSPPSPEGSPIDLQLSPDTTKEDMDIVKGTSRVPQYSPRGGNQSEHDKSKQVHPSEAVYNPRVHLDPRQIEPMEDDSLNDELYIPQSTAPPLSGHLSALAQIQQMDTSGDSTPVKDEAESTPTQDEFPETTEPNPVDFLTRLINQSKKSSDLSPSFLQNLSMLRETVKKQAAVAQLLEDSDSKDKSQSPTSSGPSSWAAWKAKKQAVSQSQSEASTPGQESDPPASIHNGRKSLDERLQEQLEDVASKVQAPAPPLPTQKRPVESIDPVTDMFFSDLEDRNYGQNIPVPVSEVPMLSHPAPIHDSRSHDSHLRLSFSPPSVKKEIKPRHLSPIREGQPISPIQLNLQPKKSILKNSNVSNVSNITVHTGGSHSSTPSPISTISTPDMAESPGLSIPTIGSHKRIIIRPSFAPRGQDISSRVTTPSRPSGPPPPPSQKPTEGRAEIQNEFISKLKQKTATPTQTNPVMRQNSNSNLKTVITVDAGEPPPPPPTSQQKGGPNAYSPGRYQHPPFDGPPDFSHPPPRYDPIHAYDHNQTYPEPPLAFDPSKPPPGFDSREPPRFKRREPPPPPPPINYERQEPPPPVNYERREPPPPPVKYERREPPPRVNYERQEPPPPPIKYERREPPPRVKYERQEPPHPPVKYERREPPPPVKYERQEPPPPPVKYERREPPPRVKYERQEPPPPPPDQEPPHFDHLRQPPPPAPPVFDRQKPPPFDRREPPPRFEHPKSPRILEPRDAPPGFEQHEAAQAPPPPPPFDPTRPPPFDPTRPPPTSAAASPPAAPPFDDTRPPPNVDFPRPPPQDGTPSIPGSPVGSPSESPLPEETVPSSPTQETPAAEPLPVQPDSPTAPTVTILHHAERKEHFPFVRSATNKPSPSLDDEEGKEHFPSKRKAKKKKRSKLHPKFNDNPRPPLPLDPNFDDNPRPPLPLHPNFDDNPCPPLPLHPNFDDNPRPPLPLHPNFDDNPRPLLPPHPNFDNNPRPLMPRIPAWARPPPPPPHMDPFSGGDHFREPYRDFHGQPFAKRPPRRPFFRPFRQRRH